MSEILIVFTVATPKRIWGMSETKYYSNGKKKREDVLDDQCFEIILYRQNKPNSNCSHIR